MSIEKTSAPPDKNCTRGACITPEWCLRNGRACEDQVFTQSAPYASEVMRKGALFRNIMSGIIAALCVAAWGSPGWAAFAMFIIVMYCRRDEG